MRFRFTRALVALAVLMFLASVSFAALRPFARIRERVQERPGAIAPHLRGGTGGCSGQTAAPRGAGCYGAVAGCQGVTAAPLGCSGGSAGVRVVVPLPAYTVPPGK